VESVLKESAFFTNIRDQQLLQANCSGKGQLHRGKSGSHTPAVPLITWLVEKTDI